jgi:hypothetical protein
MHLKDAHAIQDAILALHGCESKHVASVPVRETFHGQKVWEGNVEVFDLIGHAKAKRAYGRMFEEDGKQRYIAVLEIPPVTSPESAVKISIAAKARQQKDT